MRRVELLKFCSEALAHYGSAQQVEQMCEECIELDEALVAWAASSWKDENQKARAAVDEIADVLIMAEQMRIAFGADAVDERIAFKVKRQRERMAREGE